MSDNVEPRGRGRVTTFTVELATEIVERLSLGEPMAVICRDDHMPTDRTVRNWMTADPDFASAIAGARASGFDVLAAQCLQIADTPLQGQETVTKADGAIEVREGDMLGHRKLQIETRLKLLAKWDPKRFGERLALSGDDDAPPIRHRIERVIVRPSNPDR